MGSEGHVCDIHEQLRHAAIEGKVDQVEGLIKQGADCNQANSVSHITGSLSPRGQGILYSRQI